MLVPLARALEADDVVGLIDALAIAKPVLLGHSMGGMTAAVVTSRHYDQPDRFAAVVQTFLRSLSA